MKVVILAGGYGTRLSEETGTKPKPMVDIGGIPIIMHIMRYFMSFGHNEFVICLGYKGEVIKDYFTNYQHNNSDFTIDSNSEITIHKKNKDYFKVTLVDTGLNTNTAGRIKKIKKYTENKPFFMTYGDGVSNIDLNELLSFHAKNNTIATLTSVKNTSSFGNLIIESDGVVSSFKEKEDLHESWINAGYFVLEQEIFNYLNLDDIDEIQWEHDPLTNISKDKELSAFKHFGFWKAMDKLSDKVLLEKIWNTDSIPWKK